MGNKFAWNPKSAPETVRDWAEVQDIEKDILLLYHQQSEYSSIMGDLYYGDVFSKPYWRYLDPSGLEHEQYDFINDGCLVMILAMAWGMIDGADNYLEQHLPELAPILNNLVYKNKQTGKLLRTVKLAVHEASESEGESEELIELSNWVHKTYVKGYFISKSEI